MNQTPSFLPKRPDRTSPTRGKTWKAGTLTYTSAGLAALFFWLLLGDFAWAMRDRSVGPIAQWYLNHLGGSNLLYALLLGSFPAILILILTPIISVKSDRHRGKWGRRLPFLIVTTPIGALGIIGIGLTPYIARWVHGFLPNQSEALVAFVCFGIFWAVFELATIVGQAVFGGLINDVVPRELMGRFHSLFRAISLIDGAIFNYCIFGKVPEHFTAIMVGVGLFYGICVFWMCLKLKEGDYPPPPPRDTSSPGLIKGFWSGAHLYFRECFTKPYYISLIILMALSGIAFTPFNSFNIPYATSLGVSMDAYGKCVVVIFIASLGLSYFLGWLADRFHPLRMAIATLLIYILMTIWGTFAATTPKTFMLALVLHGISSGAYITSAASLGARLFPVEKYAQFVSATRLFASLISIVLKPLTGILLDWSGNGYRYTFAIGAVFASISFIAACLAYRSFMKLGGPQHYVAPE